MNLQGPHIVSPGAEVKISINGSQGNLDGYALVNGQRSPLRITSLPHGLISIALVIPSSCTDDVLIRVSDGQTQWSHTILVI